MRERHGFFFWLRTEVFSVKEFLSILEANANGISLTRAYHDASYSLDYDRRELNNFFEMIDIECAQVVVVYCIAIGQVPVTISHAEDYGC